MVKLSRPLLSWFKYLYRTIIDSKNHVRSLVIARLEATISKKEKSLESSICPEISGVHCYFIKPETSRIYLWAMEQFSRLANEMWNPKTPSCLFRSYQWWVHLSARTSVATVLPASTLNITGCKKKGRIKFKYM